MAARLGQLDQRILRTLQEDARVSNHDLSIQLRVAPSTITKHIQKLTQMGVITGFTANVQPSLIGFETMAFALIRCTNQSQEYVDQLIDTLKSAPGISEIYKVLGEDDFMIRIYARNNDEYQTIIENLGDGGRDGHHIHTILVTQTAYLGGLGAVVEKDSRRNGSGAHELPKNDATA